ncbi:MAG: 2Fe-2S iron-sulfur cluster-binding protein [Myxococcota bacterium]|nr:2Fe-2S iron-sulfur cluster-binding protein [Myxococcota bacterium]
MSAQKHPVTFIPDQSAVTVTSGRRLLSVIREAGKPIGYACRGRGVCTACVVFVSGDAGPINDTEQALLDRVPVPVEIDREFVPRIACLACVRGPLHVFATYW